MTIFFVLLALAAYGVHTVWKLKKQLHTLQLNSYRTERYFRWLKQNFRKTIAPLDAIPAIGLLPVLFGEIGMAALIWIAAYAALFFFRSPQKEKKPLVWTQRAIRLFAAMLILLIGLTIPGLSAWLASNSRVIAFMLFTGLLLLNLFPCALALAANVVTTPLESAINRWFYNDARRRIRQMPRLRVIGITGSFGKTSTKTMLQRMLAEEFHVVMTPESYNTPMGVTKVIRSTLTPVHEMFVVEMGARQPGDIRELCELVAPKIGVLTAIGEQHLETFHDIETIIRTKHELIEALPPDGVAFLNMDNEHVRSVANLTPVKKIFYGIDSDDLHYSAKNLRVSGAGSAFEFCTPDGRQKTFHTRLLGKHNIYNIVAAAAVACELGMDLAIIAAVVKNLDPVTHRLELKKTAQNITIIDDAYNSNPVGAHSALDVLASMEGGQRILITPGMVELGAREYELNHAFGKHAAECCDYVILVGQKQTIPIQEGLKASNYQAERCYVAANLTDANRHLWTFVKPGDFVMYENDLPDTYNEQ